MIASSRAAVTLELVAAVRNKGVDAFQRDHADASLMPQAVTNVFQRIGRVIAGFSLAQRTIAIIGVAVLALGIVALSSWLSRPTYTPLFSGR